MKPPAKLRTCASCEWIFDAGIECPRCGFGSYGAHYVYGNKAYRYAITQKPWLDKKMENYFHKLRVMMNKSVEEKNEME